MSTRRREGTLPISRKSGQGRLTGASSWIERKKKNVKACWKKMGKICDRQKKKLLVQQWGKSRHKKKKDSEALAPIEESNRDRTES